MSKLDPTHRLVVHIRAADASLVAYWIQQVTFLRHMKGCLSVSFEPVAMPSPDQGEERP